MSPKLKPALAAILDRWPVGTEHGVTYVMGLTRGKRAKAVEVLRQMVALELLADGSGPDKWKRIA